MVWQDIAIMIVNSIFVLSLIPQVYHGFKEKKGFIRIETSLPTFLGCYVMAFAFYTLSLIYSALTASITATLWLVLFIQRIVYKKA